MAGTSTSASASSFPTLTLSPPFAAATTSYTATVPFATTHVKLRVSGVDESSGYLSPTVLALGIPRASMQATLQDGTTVQKTSTAVLGGNLDFGPVALSVGENPITVRVTAQDGTTTKAYTVTVTRQKPPAPTGLTVTPGDAQLSLSWSAPPASVGTVGNYDVHYTSASSAAVTNAAVANGDNVDPAAGWVIALETDTNTVSKHTIRHNLGSTPLINGTTYRVRVHYNLDSAGNFATSDWAYATGTPRAALTVSLEVWETASEGDYPVRIMAELSEPSESDVDIRFALTLDTAELADFATEPDSGVVFDSGASPVTGTRTLTVPAGEYNAEFDLYTEHDEDGDDETFTVTIDTTSLPAGYIAGSPTSAQVKIDDDETRNPDPDLLTGLTIHDGTRELYFDASTGGDQVGLGGPDAIYTVQVNPGIRSVTVTPVWTNSAINSIIGYVRYVTYGRDGGTVSWTGSESGTGKEVSLVDPALGAPGTTRVEFTLVDSGNEQPYVFLFQHNFDWENANNRLGGLVMRASQSQ